MSGSLAEELLSQVAAMEALGDFSEPEQEDSLESMEASPYKQLLSRLRE